MKWFSWIFYFKYIIVEINQITGSKLKQNSHVWREKLRYLGTVQKYFSIKILHLIWIKKYLSGNFKYIYYDK